MRVAVPRVTREQLGDQRGQRAGLEIALADLDQIDAGVGRAPRLRDQAGARRAGAAPAATAPPIGDQADHRVSSCSDTSRAVARGRRQIREIGEAGEQVDDAEAADRAAHEVVRQEASAAAATPARSSCAPRTPATTAAR